MFKEAVLEEGEDNFHTGPLWKCQDQHRVIPDGRESDINANIQPAQNDIKSTFGFLHFHALASPIYLLVAHLRFPAWLDT